MSYSCYRCNAATVQEEYQRCIPCEKEHQELCAKLDARPKVKVQKVREELFPLKEGDKTMWIDRESARFMGIKLPEFNNED